MKLLSSTHLPPPMLATISCTRTTTSVIPTHRVSIRKFLVQIGLLFLLMFGLTSSAMAGISFRNLYVYPGGQVQAGGTLYIGMSGYAKWDVGPIGDSVERIELIIDGVSVKTVVLPFTTTPNGEQVINKEQQFDLTAPVNASPTPHKVSIQITTVENRPGATATYDVSVTTAQSGQSISFPAPAGIVYASGATVTLTATATSALPVSYQVGPATVCTLSSGNVVAVQGAGTCSITASQPGNISYTAATSVPQVLTIAKASQNLVFDPIAAKTYGDPSVPLSASSSVQLPITFGSTGSCSVSGTTLILSGAGSCSVTAQQAGNGNYNAASKTNTFTISKASQVISFGSIAGRAVGAPPFTVSASAYPGLTVSFSTSSSACGVVGTTVTINGAGQCDITASQGGNTNVNAASPVTRSFFIAATAQTITFDALSTRTYGDSPFSVSASATSGLAVSFSSLTGGVCSVSNGVVTILSGGSCTIAANQGGGGSYASAPQVTQSFSVLKKGQTVNFGALAPKLLSASSFVATATADSGLPVTLTSTTTDICSVNATSPATVSLNAAGVCTIVASQLGDGRYTQASQVGQSARIVAPAGAPLGAEFLDQVITTPMRASRPYMVTIRMINTGTTTWTPEAKFRLGYFNPQDSRRFSSTARAYLTGPVPSGGIATFLIPITAPALSLTYAFQWKMVQDGVTWFGLPTDSVNIPVLPASGPSAKLAVSPVNARMNGATPVTLTFSGSGAEPGRVITQLDLLRDIGSGFEATAVNTVTGGAASLAMAFTAPATAGSYKFKVRSTDDQGLQTDSDIVAVNVSADSSTLLGSVSGVRLDAAGKPQLVGWVCQKGSTQQLSYEVLLDYPSVDIGAEFLEGAATVRVANLATEADNAAVQSTCATPGTAHHFNVDLSPYTSTKTGRAMYVRVLDASSNPIATLPCADNSCTVPGSLRLALSTPLDGQQIVGPAPVFVRTQLSGGTGPYDEVALSVDGNWVTANPDGAVDAFSVTTAQLDVRTAPYAVQARVRQGNMTLYSQVSRVTMAAGTAPTVTMDAGLDGLTIGSPSDLVLTATTTGITTGFSVKFVAGGQPLVAGVGSGSTWRGTWTNIAANRYVVTAQLFNGVGQLVSTSPPVTITAGYTATPSDSTPLAVAIAPPHTGNADAGTLPGSLSVTPAGAAAYSLPIEVPPGAAGMQPSLSLDYSSSAPNSMVGLGWSLGGMSSIHRCGKTIAQDGVNGRIGFDNEDRLCLDGKRLVLANVALTDSSYWADNAEFRTELEEFSRITAVVTNGKRSFRVEQKNGRVMTYGSTADSYVNVILGTPNSGLATSSIPPVKSGAQSWALDRIADPMGNYVKFSYAQDAATGEHHPVLVRYGAAGLASHAAVALSYESRKDAWTRYIDETRNDLRTRLTHIKTYVGSNLDGDPTTTGTVVRDYALSYEYSPTSGRSMLNQVQASARNPVTGIMDSMPATTFNWGKPDASKQPGFVSKGFWSGGPIMTTYKTFNGITNGANHADYFAFSDFEHHGFTDVLEKRVASMFTNTPEGTNGTNSNPPGTAKTSYRYFHNTGSGFMAYTYKLYPEVAFTVLDIGDFDGDGALDLLVSTSGGAKICLSPLGRPGALGAPGSTIIFTCDPLRTAAGSNALGYEPYVVDMLGDGRSAIYGPTNINGWALFCIQTTPCVNDQSPPSVLGGKMLDDGTSDFSLHSYTSIQQMVDFTGIGKPYDVRWSNPHSVEYVYVDNEQHYWPHWENLAPTVTMNNFHLPGSLSTAGNMVPFVYPDFPSPPVNSVIPPYEFDKPEDGAGLSGDFNGSGYNSLAFGFLDVSFANGVKTYNRAEMTLCLSTGRALDCHVRKKYSGNQYASVAAVGNFIGDGQPSILVSTMAYAAGVSPTATGEIKMCSVYSDDTTGDINDAGINCVPWSWSGSKTPWNIYDKILHVDLLGTGRTQILYYHGGTVNASNVWQEDGRWELFEPVDLSVAGQALDRIYQVKNGLGARSTVTYADGLASGVVTTPNNVALAYPQHVAGSPGKVVQRISHENGVAGDRSTVYAYQDPAIDVAGRGALGYAQVSSTDEQTGIVTTSTFGLVWPYTGNALTTSVSSGGIVLSSTVNALAVQSITQANGAKTSFVYTSNSKLCRKDLDGSELGCSSTDVGYDTWGNQLSQATGYSVGGVDSGFSNRVDNTYKTCSANWMPSLPVQTSTTKTDPVSGTLTRTMAYDYDCASGLIKTSTVEPDDGTLTVATTYGRTNAFGLVNTTTQSWQNPFNGQMMSRIVSDVSYDANGRYPLSVKNALGHTENYTYEAGTGARKTLQDINGLGSSWVTDGFGRVTKEVHPDGNEVRSYVKQCAGDCPPQATMARIIDTFHGSDRIAVPTVGYADAVGHVLRTLTWGFDGRAVNVDQRYDEVKRVYEADQPRFDGATAFLASRQERDILNRVVLSSVMSEAGTLATTRTDRSGFTTVVTNALTQRRTETRNVLGQLIQVKDPNNKLTSFGYEPFGALNNTIDPNGNVIQVGYDLWGRKTLLKDPDLGLVTYGVDPLGRTYQQLTPKLRVAKHAGGSLPGVLMFYDDLDRMINRAEPDLSSYWVYDGAANGKGKLQEAYTMIGTVKDYDRTHSYDSLGRPLLTSQRLQLISYTAQNVYDAWGRPIQQMYQRGTDAAKKFDLRYNNTGYMVRLERGSQALWKVTKQDAAARVTGTLLGNGLSQSRTFNDYTARLSGASLTTPASVEHLSEGYTYDVLGSVLTRDQHWDGAGFHEDFTYDNLNRLGTSTVQGQAKQTFTYDDAGNMLSKTGVGTGVYAYPVQGPTAVQPHAVQSIVGLSGSFVYDKNGNLTSSPGRTTTWTSFDMPLQLAKGAITANFIYGPEHQRTRQDRSDGSSVIYAGAQEVESKAGQVTVKTYWPLGVGVEIDRPGATASELNWTHLDRLGSPVAMTDDKGNLREKLAYDAWGKRRTLDGASTPDALDGQTDNRGFTGHEMLDQLDLVHMNGRVYDPLVGKFLSGDPLVQDPMNGQSYNRYSYVLNNPTNLTDPTGFRPQCYAGVGLFSTCAPSFMSQLLDGARQGFDNFLKFATATPEPGKVDAKKGQVTVKNVQPAAAPQEDSANSGTGFKSDFSAAFKGEEGVMAHLPGQESWGTKLGGYANYLVEAPSFIPLLGGLYDYGRSAAHGDGTGMLLAAGSIGADIFTGGTAGAALRAEGKFAAKELAYSVAFETTIDKVGAGTRASHFTSANNALTATMQGDAAFAKSMDNLGIKVDRMDRSPAGWSWHHVPDQPGVMQLVPRGQHQGGPWQSLFHPGQVGGFKLWGSEF